MYNEQEYIEYANYRFSELVDEIVDQKAQVENVKDDYSRLEDKNSELEDKVRELEDEIYNLKNNE
jgi:predicted nuclease with TOPRIM domain